MEHTWWGLAADGRATGLPRTSTPRVPSSLVCGRRGPRSLSERVDGLYLARPEESLRRNQAARRLERVGYETGLDFYLAEDTVPVVPRLQGGVFVGQEQPGPGPMAE